MPETDNRMRAIECAIGQLWRATCYLQDRVVRKKPIHKRYSGTPILVPVDPNYITAGSLGRTRGLSSTASAIPLTLASGALPRARIIAATVAAISLSLPSAGLPRARIIGATGVTALVSGGSSGLNLASGALPRARVLSSTAAARLTVVYGTRANCWHEESTVTVGNPITFTAVANCPHGGEWYQNPPANGDTFTNGFILAAGVYTFYMEYLSFPNSGKVDITIDGSAVASGYSLYSAALSIGVILTVGITISANGYHVLKVVVNGKEAASGGYFALLIRFWLSAASDVQITPV